jgi:hypothetical protein
MADINPITPIIDIILFRLYASIWILISVNTLCLRVIKKCDAPIHILMVPNGRSTVCSLSTGMSRLSSRRFYMVSIIGSCIQRLISLASFADLVHLSVMLQSRHT